MAYAMATLLTNLIHMFATKHLEFEVEQDWKYGQLFTYYTAHCRSRHKVTRAFTRVLYKRKGQPRQLVGLELHVSKL